MSSVNKVILVGNVGSDPEVRYLERGTAIANFNLATTERGYTMQNGTQVPDRTEWHPIVLWRNLAEWAEKYVRKGMKIYVEGKLQTRTWEKEGQIRRKTEIIAENIQVLYRPAEYRSPNHQSEENITRDRLIGEKLSEITGYPLIFTENSTGGYKDWCIEKLSISAFTIEVGSDKYKHPLKVLFSAFIAFMVGRNIFSMHSFAISSV